MRRERTRKSMAARGGVMEAERSLEQRLVEAIKAVVSQKQWDLWFRTMKIDAEGDGAVTLAWPEPFAKDWVGNYYGDVVKDVFATLVPGRTYRLVAAEDGPPAATDTRVGTATASPPADERAPEPRPRTESEETPTRRNHQFFLNHSDVVLNDKYTFGDFVVGASNQLAHAAAKAVADVPAGSYNPFFLHGNVGLGKTHLLQAICHQAMRTGQKRNVLYLSSETFVNEFIAAVGRGEIDRFRYRYRNVDILLIDDIHLLANKERTQEEFFHTFNSLYNAGRQIVLSSDCSPDEIPSVRERLSSRFKWGLVTEISKPHYETRLAILRQKAEARAVAVPEDVLVFLAEHIDTNIRELEGAITKVTGFAQLVGRTIDVGTARQALGYTNAAATRSVTGIDRILEVVCKHFRVRISDLQGRKRTQSIAQPRQVAMFIARKLTPLSLEEIGGHFGGRDHSTVLYAVDRTRKRMVDDPSFGLLLTELENRISS